MKKNNNGYIILDLPHYELTAEDRELLQHPHVAGVILFERNYYDLKQLSALNKAIKKEAPYSLIAVDQEGGRVQRFQEGFTLLPSMSYWGEQHAINAPHVKEELALTIKTLCRELKSVGIDINFMPVLDINHGINPMIGERSLHHDPLIITELATIIIESLQANGMPAVGKHFPGHGGVSADSHHTMPIDARSWEEINDIDLQPFRMLAKQLDMIMPAHIIFNQCDELLTTYSRFWLQKILREQLNYTGIIISDDLTMVAAAYVGDYKERAQQALDAGADLLLICNQRAGAINALESLERYPFNPEQYHRVELFKRKWCSNLVNY